MHLQKVGQLLLAVPKQHVQWTVGTNGARTQVVTHGLVPRRVREDTRSHRIWQGEVVETRKKKVSEDSAISKMRRRMGASKDKGADPFASWSK